MTGTPRSRRTFGNKVKDHSDDINTLYHLKNTTRFISTGVSPSGSGTASFREGDYLKRPGDYMVGPQGFDPKIAVLDSEDKIDISPDSGSHSSWIILVPGAGVADDLRYISPGIYRDQILFLQGVDGNVITIKNNSDAPTADDNIQTIDGEDFLLQDDDRILAAWDITDLKWHLITTGKQGIVRPSAINEMNYGLFPIAETIEVIFGNSYLSKPTIVLSFETDPEITFDPTDLFYRSELVQDPGDDQYTGCIVHVYGTLPDPTDGIYVSVHGLGINDV